MLGKGDKLKILNSRGEGEKKEYELVLYTNNKKVGSSFWLLGNAIMQKEKKAQQEIKKVEKPITSDPGKRTRETKANLIPANEKIKKQSLPQQLSSTTASVKVIEQNEIPVLKDAPGTIRKNVDSLTKPETDYTPNGLLSFYSISSSTKQNARNIADTPLIQPAITKSEEKDLRI
jgi:hypothetical protein